MHLRTWLCFNISRRLMKPARTRTVDYAAYDRWRQDSLSNSWSAFDDSHVTSRDVLDFGCGDGQLSMFLARTMHPRRIVGVDVDAAALERAKAALRNGDHGAGAKVDFAQGTSTTIPMPDQTFDTVLAFDCMEHVMEPAPIMREWYRVLRPGGRCLIEWFPYKGPWGPHMESIIPIPWAHVLFGERAMFRSAEKIYDLPEFESRHWDLDANGHKKPNKWRAWSNFAEQGYINQLDIDTFNRMAAESGFVIARSDNRSFTGSRARQAAGKVLMALPRVGEYFVSSYVLELQRPECVAT